MHDQQAVTSSLQVAETFGKQHYHVMEAIQDLLSSPENSGLLENAFAEGALNHYRKELEGTLVNYPSTPRGRYGINMPRMIDWVAVHGLEDY